MVWMLLADGLITAPSHLPLDFIEALKFRMPFLMKLQVFGENRNNYLLTLLLYLLHVGSGVIVTSGRQTLLVPPSSMHVSVVGAFGMRSPLQEYSIVSPARNKPVMSVGVVAELGLAVGGLSQTKNKSKCYLRPILLDINQIF